MVSFVNAAVKHRNRDGVRWNRGARDSYRQNKARDTDLLQATSNSASSTGCRLTRSSKHAGRMHSRHPPWSRPRSWCRRRSWGCSTQRFPAGWAGGCTGRHTGRGRDEQRLWRHPGRLHSRATVHCHCILTASLAPNSNSACSWLQEILKTSWADWIQRLNTLTQARFIYCPPAVLSLASQRNEEKTTSAQRVACWYLQLDLLFQVLVGPLQKFFSAQDTVPHHVLGSTPVSRK